MLLTALCIKIIL
jgi:hypothetical protein